MTRTDLTLRLLGLGVPSWSHIFFYDESYAEPSKTWLVGSFYQWFRGRVERYTKKHDCDNFSRAFCVFAQWSHSLTTQPDEAAAVGEFLYTTREGILHAIVLAFTDEGPVFLEPQNGQVLTLTPNEIASCFSVRF